MKTKAILHPDELTKKWINRAIAQDISVIALHSVGNKEAHINLANDLSIFESSDFKALVDYANSNGIEIEYELHAISYLLPRELFNDHPEYFRVDKDGNRNPFSNLCVSNEEALEIVAENALKLVKKLYGSSHNYFLWSDDIKGAHCNCEKCSKLSPSEQNLILMNAIVKKLRSHIPDARLAYLAYYDTVEVPKNIKPEDGIFLEYAPYERDLFKPASIVSQSEIVKMKDLLSFFGKENSCVLEYWYDNSYFSGYVKPPKKLTPNTETIINDFKFYLDLGFENISSFACFLGPDYDELYDEIDLSGFNKKHYK